MYSLHTKGVCLGLLALVAACGEAPEYRFGQNITGIQFELFDTSEGIFPSEVTLDNPRNPFREFDISDDNKFAILTGGGNAGAFYAWATLLARIPIGENQYGAALKLRHIYEANELTTNAEQETVRQMAVDGFQAILDCFPESLLYDPTGTFPVARLATLAYAEIIELRGVPKGDWFLLPDSRGNLQAVRSTSFDALAREELCF